MSEFQIQRFSSTVFELKIPLRTLTAIQVSPGSLNKGIFINLTAPNPGAGESYHISQPTAQVNGLLKGQYYGTISDKIMVTQKGGKPGRKYRAIIEYRDEVSSFFP